MPKFKKFLFFQFSESFLYFLAELNLFYASYQLLALVALFLLWWQLVTHLFGTTMYAPLTHPNTYMFPYLQVVGCKMETKVSVRDVIPKIYIS